MAPDIARFGPLLFAAIVVASLLILSCPVKADVWFSGTGAGILGRSDLNSSSWNVFANLNSTPPVVKIVALKFDERNKNLWWSNAASIAYCPMDPNWYCTAFYNVSLPSSDVNDFDIDYREGSAYFFSSAAKQLYKARSPLLGSWKNLDSSQVLSLVGNISAAVPDSKYGIAIYTERLNGKTWLYTLRQPTNIFDPNLYVYRVDITSFPSSISSDASEEVFSYNAGHLMNVMRMNIDKSTGVLYIHDVPWLNAFLPIWQTMLMFPTDPLPSSRTPSVFQTPPSTETVTYNQNPTTTVYLGIYCVKPASHWSVETTAVYTVSWLLYFTVFHSYAGPLSLPDFGTPLYNRTLATPSTQIMNDVSGGATQVATAFDDKLILAAGSTKNQSNPQERYVGIISSRSGYYIAARQKNQFAEPTNPSARIFLNTTLTDPDEGEISPDLLSMAVDNNAGVLYWSNSAREIWAYSIDGHNSSRLIKDSSSTFSKIQFDYRHSRLLAVLNGTGHIAVFSPSSQSYSHLTASPFADLVSLAVYHRQGILFIVTADSIYRGALPLDSQLPIPDYEFCGDDSSCGPFTRVASAPSGTFFRDIAIDQTKGLLWAITDDGIVRMLNSITCSHPECTLSAVVLKVTNSAPFNGVIRKLLIEEQQIPQYETIVSDFTNGVRIDNKKISPNKNEMIVLTDDGKVHTVVHFTSTIEDDNQEVFLSTFVSPSTLIANNPAFSLSIQEVTTLLYPHFDLSQLLDCSGSCKLYCLPGFTPSSSGPSCEACPINTAKNFSGIEECSACRTYLWPLSYEDPGNITCTDHMGDQVTLVGSFIGILIFLVLVCLVLVVIIIIMAILGIFGASRMKKTKEAPNTRITSPTNTPTTSLTVMPPINESFGGIHSKASIRVDTTRYDAAADEFRILQKIGSGSYSNVYKAEYRNDVVALKRLNLAAVTDETSSNTPGSPMTDEVRALTSEFEHEASILATLRHKNIVSFVAAVTTYPNYAIATEYMEMGSLFDILKHVKAKQQQMSWKIKLQVICDVAKGMEYLHRSGLIHRDLKSPNILLDSKFTAKVSDFGLSRMKEKAVSVMTANVGSPLWLAPEVTLGLQYDNKCDVFSFGIVMWELLTNEQPYFDFKGPKIQIHMKVATDQTFRPTIPSSLPGNVSESEYLVLMRICWDHDPTKRPAFGEIAKSATSMIK